jgi:PAS domain S-box-containing protein
MTSARTKADTANTEAGAAAGARLARLLDASPAVVYSFEAKGDFSPTYVSDNITRLFGYAAQDYLDDPDFWRGHVHPDDLARVEAEMSGLFAEGRHVCEYRFRGKDGTYCWGERRADPCAGCRGRAARGGGLVERHLPPQSGRGGRGARAGAA